MNVFPKAITLSVMLVVFGSSNVEAGWKYDVDGPHEPNISHVKHLTNPSMNDIQNAIEPKTRIDIIGEVDASNGQRLYINANDVRLNFARANKVRWSGADHWGGFIEVAANRVEIRNLEMECVGNSRCRGMVVYDVSDLMVRNCEFRNIADGVIADANWERLAFVNTSFIDCSDWTSSSSMEGGYGMFMEDDDGQPDHLWIEHVTVTLANSSGQHGVRIAKVEDIRIQDSFIGANNKRSMWAYGVERMTVCRTTFDTGSVLFNLKTDEHQTNKPTRQVRMYRCEINHDSIMEPLQVYCGKGSVDLAFKNIDITSTYSANAINVGWRSGADTRKVRWYNGTITFNGQTMNGEQFCKIDDWSNQEMNNLVIGAVPNPADED